MTLFDPRAKIDWHAHVFQAGVVAGARYAPTRTATPEQFICNFSDGGFEGGLLIQPSFLGTDNSQMMEAIAHNPDKLKGIAVVDTTIDTETMNTMTRGGIIGCRLNLFGKEVPNLESGEWSAFLGRLEEADWQLELHAPPKYLVKVLPMLRDFTGDVVIDHFGRPDVDKGLDDPDYQKFLSLLNPNQHWVKTSGWYRLGSDPSIGLERATAAKQLLEQAGVGDRLLWGSDWPHTQHDAISYSDALRAKTALGD